MIQYDVEGPMIPAMQNRRIEPFKLNPLKKNVCEVLLLLQKQDFRHFSGE